MTNKEYLQQAYWIDRRVSAKLAQLASLWSLATKATSTMSDMPPAATRNNNPLAAIVEKIIVMEQEINTDIDALVDLKREIMGVIASVQEPEQKTVLEMRYLCFREWPHIAALLGYNVRHVYKIHSQALEACEPVISSKSQTWH